MGLALEVGILADLKDADEEGYAPAQSVVTEAVAVENARDSALGRFDVEAIRRRNLCMPAAARSMRGIAADEGSDCVLLVADLAACACNALGCAHAY